MKIEITTKRLPWANGEPQPLGAVIDVDDEVGQAMKDAGFAKPVAGRPKKDAD